jgi:hypothetical protein
VENHGLALGRVEEDLARGHTHVAIQRLSTLVNNDPADLGLRRRLAEIHLSTGNLIEAGRWSYLLPDRDPAAVAAFEKANRDPRARMNRLRWPVLGLPKAPEFARRTLEDLELAARNAEAGTRSRGVLLSQRERVSDRFFSVGLTGLLLVNVAVWVLGYVALVRRIF